MALAGMAEDSYPQDLKYHQLVMQLSHLTFYTWQCCPTKMKIKKREIFSQQNSKNRNIILAMKIS